MTGCCKEDGTKDQCCQSESAETTDAMTAPALPAAQGTHACAGHS